MNKKQFIQEYVKDWTIENKPEFIHEIRDHGIKQAEKAWEVLSKAGYGDAKQQKMRESVDYYGQLVGDSKSWFDRFWNAYNHKEKKQQAASAWLKLFPANQTHNPEFAAKIVKAAKADAMKPRPKEFTRLYPQGWLNQRCFDDYSESEMEKPKRNQEKLILESEKRFLLSVLPADPTESTEKRLDEINARLEELR